MRNALGEKKTYYLQIIGPYNLVSKFLKHKRDFMVSKAYFPDETWWGWERNPYSITYCDYGSAGEVPVVCRGAAQSILGPESDLDTGSKEEAAATDTDVGTYMR